MKVQAIKDLKVMGDMIQGKYGNYLIYSDKSIKVSPKFMAINLYFSSEKEIERYRYYRFINKLNKLSCIDKLLNEAVRVIHYSKCL